MNERIKQLALQAGFAHEPNKDQLWVGGPTELMISPGLEKFAELIVRECAVVADRFSDGVVGTQWGDMMFCYTVDIGKEVIDYFGVEE